MVNSTILKYRTKLANRRRLSSRGSKSFPSSSTIGILFTVEDIDKHNNIKKFIEKLEAENKKVSSICFLPKGKDNFEFLFNFFTKKEIGYFGQLKNEYLKDFLNQSFDYLFLLDQKSTPCMQYILANSQAKCRVGLAENQNQEFMELLIKPKSKTMEDIVDDLLTYIKKIK